MNVNQEQGLARDRAHRPLEGVRVLELAHLIPGPLLARKLGDLGAEVVKVEPPHGDSFRRYLPVVEGRSVLFETANRGKRSIVLDLGRQADRDTFLDLTRVADAVVDGFRLGALERLGIRWDDVRRRSPQLVVCSLTGFGQTGPLASLPAHGLNIEALAGSATVVEVDDEYRFGFDTAWGVEVGAVNGALATVAAILHARATGEGAWIDVSCWDAAVEAQRWLLGPLLAGTEPSRLSGHHAPTQSIYRSRDGVPVSLVLTERRLWENFCRVVGREDLVGRWQPRDYSDGTILPGDDDLRREIAAVVAEASGAEWNDRFVTGEVAGSAILGPDDVLDHPHLAARGLVVTSPGTGVPFFADPIRYVEADHRPGEGQPAAPELGADSDRVLSAWLGDVRRRVPAERGAR